MRRTLALAVVLAAGACGPQKFTSHLTHYCSVDPDDDPYYTCAKGLDLVCINTYTIPVVPKEGPATARPAYICRLACEPGEPCRDVGEVCCPGTIKGVTYGKTHACVPPSLCATIDAAPPREAGVRLGANADAGGDMARDASAGQDGAPDTRASATPDVALDAPMAPPAGGDAQLPDHPDAPALDAPSTPVGGDARSDA
jgi:hypothetical protein